MSLGASSPAAKSRPRLVDLNLIPPEYRRRPFPFLTTGLALLALGSLVLVYAIFYAKIYSDLEVASLSTRVTQGRALVQSATGNPTELAQQGKLRAMRDDYQTLTERQIHWGDVFQIVGDVPPGVILKTISQAGYGVTVNGSAVNQATASRYLDQLRGSGLFVNASIQVNPSSGTVAFGTPTAIPTQPPASTPVPAPAVRLPTAQPSPVSYPTPRPPPAAVPTQRKETPTVTRTTTVTPTPTSAFDFVLVSSQQLPASNPNVGDTDIRGKVLASTGKPFPGVQIEIDSEGSPPWSDTTTTAADGTFDFTVTHGKFAVYPLSGNPQHAVDLYTGADGVPGSFNYQLVFRATFTGTIPPTVVGTATLTPTYTTVPTTTPTPVSPGANLASLGCASAYMVQNGVVKPVPNNNNPNLAIDGNLGTEWNAGIAPNSGTQVIWQWSLPEPGHALSGCSALGLPDSQDQIDGFQLIPDQNPAGSTTHELWLYSDPGCTTNVASTNTAYYTWSGYTSAGQILPLRIEPPLPVRCVIVRTLADPSNVAWEEVQIFQELAPPSGFPTLTATPTMTPSGPTQTATPSPIGSTPTVTLTPTYIRLIPNPGPNIANCGVVNATSSGVSGPTPTSTPTSTGALTPCPTGSASQYSAQAAVDGDESTYWDPVAPSGTSVSDRQWLVETFGRSPSYDPSTGDPFTGTISDVRIIVRSSNPAQFEEYYVVITGLTPFSCPLLPSSTVGTATPTPSGFYDYQEIDCLPPTPMSKVTKVSVELISNGACSCQDGSHGIRELEVFEPPAPPKLAEQQMAALPTASGTGPAQGQKRIDVFVGTGRGQGPGGAVSGVPSPVDRQAQKTSPGPSTDAPAPIPPTSEPVDFTIILEVASGKGYP